MKIKPARITKPNASTPDFEEKGVCYEVGISPMLRLEKLDGQCHLMNYAHLLDAWTENTTDKNILKIFYPTRLITIEGYCLEKLIEYLQAFELKLVRASDNIHLAVDETEPFVINIDVKWKG